MNDRLRPFKFYMSKDIDTNLKWDLIDFIDDRVEHIKRIE